MKRPAVIKDKKWEWLDESHPISDYVKELHKYIDYLEARDEQQNGNDYIADVSGCFLIMTRSTKVHLDGITKESFTNWLSNHAFITYASSTGKNGLVELGVDGRGNYAVRVRHKTGRDTHFYNNANKAIKSYGEFLD